MGTDFYMMFLEIIGALVILLPLVYVSLKLGGGKLQNIQSGRFTKVIERTALSKEASIDIVKLGEKVYVMSCTKEDIKIIKELSQEEIRNLEEPKKIVEIDNLKGYIKKILHKKED